MKSPSVEPSSQRIDKLERRIRESDIKIPDFQRGYVWKQDQIIELLESIINNYPIGSILLWEVTAKEKLKSARNIAGYLLPEKSENYPVHYVLDGQQRISSIFGVFSNFTTQDIESEKYNPSPDIFEIFYDFKEKKFIAKKDCDTSTNHIFHLRNLLNVEQFIPATQKLAPEFIREAQDLQSKFLNYDVPVVTIKNTNRLDVAKIFERINNTGTKLSLVDLMTAWTWTEEFHLLDAADSLQQDLEEKGFGNINYKLLLQISAAIIVESTTTDSILSIDAKKFRDSWKKICESMRKCIDFLSTELSCQNIDFLPFNQQLVPLCYFFSIVEKQNAKQNECIKRWFWMTSFSDRYSTGRTTLKMDADIITMKGIKDNNFSIIEKYDYTVVVQDLIAAQFSKTNPLTRGLLLLMAQSSPKDLVTGKKIDLGKALSSFNRKEYHHVFPNAYLMKMDEPKIRRFSLMNFCFLTSESNKKIYKKAPSEYFETCVSKEKFPQIMRSNLLPDERNLYKKNNFDGFLDTRAETIMSKINSITS